MAYTINRFNSATLSVVEDGTIDQTTDLKLVGKNYAGYGEIQNENFVYLLENFSNATAPPRPISGQVWFDSSESKLKFYDGVRWRTTGGAEVTSSQPVGLKEGDFWWDTANEQLYAQNSEGEFVLVGPQSAGSGQTQVVSRTVRDTQAASRAVITGVVNDEVIFIVSNADFTIDSSDAENAIAGFDRVRVGLTLKNTLNANNGVTSSAHRYWGTASNAEKLGGVDASGYIQSANADFTTQATFVDLGFTVGDSNDLKIFIDNDNQAFISNEVGNLIILRAKDTGGTVREVSRIEAGVIKPGNGQTVALGTVSEPFDNVHATNLTGLASSASTLATTVGITTTNRQASESATAGSVAVRTNDVTTVNGQSISAGSLFANYFVGISTQAQYADLAEKYESDKEYPIGTVMSVGGEKEVKDADLGNIAIGVISENPAYLMNAECEGQAVALKGRVPVRVTGPVSKGMPVYVCKGGVASTIASNSLVGIALESNDDTEEKLVECVLKV